MTEMTPRRQAILGLVIRSYVEKGAPVGSKAFVDSYGVQVSPATIRNEMAALEEMGYLTHPHTSAGRVPTEKGYRYFVQHLVGDTELSASEQLMIRHQFHQARLELDQWVQLAVAVLAHTTRKAALATPPRTRENRFKHLELIGLRDATVLLVLVLEGGTVKQQMLTLEQPVEQAELSRISNEFNERCRSQTGWIIAGGGPATTGVARQVRGIVVQTMIALDQQAGDPMYRDGLVHVLEEPEFAEGVQVRHMLHTLEGPTLIDVVMTAAEPLEVGGVQVLIGGEGRWRDLNELSLVLSRYGVKGGASGLLGVLGPTRMTYDRIIGSVRYISGLMSALVGDWYNSEDGYPEAG
jgi:heat-inducible transcriptional repressor